MHHWRHGSAKLHSHHGLLHSLRVTLHWTHGCHRIHPSPCRSNVGARRRDRRSLDTSSRRPRWRTRRRRWLGSCLGRWRWGISWRRGRLGSRWRRKRRLLLRRRRRRFWTTIGIRNFRLRSNFFFLFVR
ncbi:hypothetical protein FHG87_011136 [Trinorchestia longiramus]|nr:hypothetical protein FHG87_011136 [Trinorchestia longiramus]